MSAPERKWLLPGQQPRTAWQAASHSASVFVIVFAVGYLNSRDVWDDLVTGVVVAALTFPVGLWMARSGRE
jgi:hypothetical protein